MSLKRDCLKQKLKDFGGFEKCRIPTKVATRVASL